MNEAETLLFQVITIDIDLEKKNPVFGVSGFFNYQYECNMKHCFSSVSQPLPW